MKTLFAVAGVAAAVAALGACSDPRPEDDVTAQAFPGADAMEDNAAAPAPEAASPATPAPTPADGAPLPNPTPTLPADQPTDSPAAGTPEPDE